MGCFSYRLVSLCFLTVVVCLSAAKITESKRVFPFVNSRVRASFVHRNRQNRSQTGKAMASSTPARKKMYPFEEARKIARGHGFRTREEFIEYECAGAYQLPKNADQVWKNEWKGWDDFLGVPLAFFQGREVARALENINSSDQYTDLMRSKSISNDDLASRLPFRPDLYYKAEWISWDDWLGLLPNALL